MIERKELSTEPVSTPELSDEQLTQVWTNVTPQHPALRRVHEKLNKLPSPEAAITSYDRMHHRHNR